MKNIALAYSNRYWSSTGHDATRAYSCMSYGSNMADGSALQSSKTNLNKIVAIHDFSYDFSK